MNEFQTYVCFCLCSPQHPFIKSAKPNSVLRALIQDAMEIKLKRQEEEEQREQDAEDDNNSVEALEELDSYCFCLIVLLNAVK